MRENSIFEARRWLAQLRKGDQRGAGIAGTAFAIDQRHLLTCAHVIHTAGGKGPGARIHLELPFDDARKCVATVLQEGWRPVPSKFDAQTAGDTALLAINDAERPLTPLPITSNRSSSGQAAISSYGFPTTRSESTIAEGLIGRPVGIEWVRVESSSSAIVEAGFSGAPAWSTDVNGAVGMVVAQDEQKQRVAYFIPIAAIAAGSPIVGRALTRTPLVWLEHMTTALDTAWIDQRALIRERVEDFVGRNSIIRQIDDHIERTDFPSGYIFVEGEPGIGKSTIMAHLAATRGYPHHFNVMNQNLRSPASFLTNICAQLITRYDLRRDILPIDVGTNSGFFHRLLVEAVNKSSLPVVVLVDALDEAEKPVAKGVNKLHLPSDLPAHCYVIVTNRLGASRDIIASRSTDAIEIHETSEENRVDIISYCTLLLGRAPEGGQSLLQAWKITAEDFLETIWVKSEGNFMYVRNVLHELLSKPPSKVTLAENLSDLPKGLLPYYERHWARMDADDPVLSRGLYEPIVCFMAAAQGPVLASDIADWMNASGKFPQTTPRIVTDVLGRQWGQFIHTDGGRPPRYRIYHGTFLEFLRGKLDLDTYDALIAGALAGEFDWHAPAAPPAK
jgi:hypothetical protein